MFKQLITFIYLLGWLVPAVATPLQIELKVFLVDVSADGTESFTELKDAVRPGQTIEYRAILTNVSESTLRAVTPELPVPEGLELLPDSIVPAAHSASLDGTLFREWPLLDVNAKPVAPEKIRSIRWPQVNLEAGQSITTALRAKVKE